MGQTLSEPVTTKETSNYQTLEYKVGSSCMQGWRVSMEDAHSCYLNLPGDESAAYFSVFDGHGGAEVARYANAHMHEKILKQPEYRAGKIAEAISHAFLKLDEEMEEHVGHGTAGSTAVACLIRNGQIYCGNSGDSRAVCSVAGVARALSNDHRPTCTTEKERIEHAGGWVECNRVNGNLALSRALGDYEYKRNKSLSVKEQIVTANPEVTVEALTNEHEFLVIACDGIWDVLSNSEVVDFVRKKLSEGIMPETICENLMMECLSTNSTMTGLGCDNMTVIIVCFLQGQPFEEFVKRCRLPAARVAVNT